MRTILRVGADVGKNENHTLKTEKKSDVASKYHMQLSHFSTKRLSTQVNHQPNINIEGFMLP